MAERVGDARRELVLRVRVRGVANHPLVLGELLGEQKRIVPDERRLGLPGRAQAFWGVNRALRWRRFEGRRCSV